MAPRPSLLGLTPWTAALEALGNAPVSVARINVDAFGRLSEQLGRSAAESLLRGLERDLSTHFPSDARLGQLGPDEYGVILPETSPETALRLLDDLVRHFARHRDPRWPPGVGLSAGIASRPAHAGSAADLLLHADEALLRAKREGRGRACLYTPAKMVLKANYYPRSQLDRLKKRARAEGRSEAELLREALDRHLQS